MGIFNKKKNIPYGTKDEQSTLVERAAVQEGASKEGEEAKKPELQMKRMGTRRFAVNEYRTFVRPLATEKAVVTGTYLFEVETGANRIAVKKAFFNIYGLMPKKVNILNQQGKRVRYGKISGVRKDWKKAIITLKKGEKIDTF